MNDVIKAVLPSVTVEVGEQRANGQQGVSIRSNLTTPYQTMKVLMLALNVVMQQVDKAQQGAVQPRVLVPTGFVLHPGGKKPGSP